MPRRRHYSDSDSEDEEDDDDESEEDDDDDDESEHHPLPEKVESEQKQRDPKRKHKQKQPPSYDEVIQSGAIAPTTPKTPTAPPLPGQNEASTSSTVNQYAPGSRAPRVSPPDNTQPCCSGFKCDSSMLKKIGYAYAAIGVFVTVPMCITMMVIGLTDGPRPDVTTNSTTTSTTTSMPTTTVYWPYWSTTYDYDRGDIRYIRCSAQPILPAVMVTSAFGGCAIFLSLLIFYLIGKKNRAECGCDACSEVTLKIFANFGLLIVVAFYILGCMCTFQMWSEQECDPFSSEGCPYTFCDNRLMAFAYIFYPATMILLAPFWITCMYLAVKTVQSIAFRKDYEDDSS